MSQVMYLLLYPLPAAGFDFDSDIGQLALWKHRARKRRSTALLVCDRAGQGVEIGPHADGVEMFHLQHLLLCISEHEVHVCTLVPNLPDRFAKDHTNRKPEYNWSGIT